ncbi:MAG: nucleotidyltransferase family protein [Elusimicrobia bacterium]|nr:nucleotidyltransferase family protein [Elusimicrobiota bacterium]
MASSEIQAVIVAGGRGERMRPWTDRIPKPMVPVAGKPILEHQLGWLKRSGVKKAVMCLGYKAEAVQAHFKDGKRWGLRLDYSVESAPRGTAGCVRDAWTQIAGDALVVYGDIFLDISLPDLRACHARTSSAATLVLAETDHPYDSDLVRVEGERVTGFYRAKPCEPREPMAGARGDGGVWAAAAVWIVGSALMDLVPADKPSDFGRDIFPAALKQGLVLGGFKTTDLIADLGTPERLTAFEKRRRKGFKT